MCPSRAPVWQTNIHLSIELNASCDRNFEDHGKVKNKKLFIRLVDPVVGSEIGGTASGLPIFLLMIIRDASINGSALK